MLSFPIRAVVRMFLMLASCATVHFAIADKDNSTGDFQSADLGSSFTNGRGSVIPCEFYLDGILIPIPTPDKKQAFLLFDTGANEPVLSAAFADRMRIRGTTSFSASGIGADVSQGSITTGITFSLPGITFRHARWAVLPDLPLDAEYGRPVVGILGMDLLKDFVIRIDYAQHTLEFLKPGQFQPPGSFASLPLDLGERGPMVPAEVRSESDAVTGQFLLDTGDNGALDLSRSFQDANPGLKFTPFAQNGASGVGGVMVSTEAVCPALDLGGIAVKHPLVGLEQAGPGLGGPRHRRRHRQRNLAAVRRDPRSAATETLPAKKRTVQRAVPLRLRRHEHPRFRRALQHAHDPRHAARQRRRPGWLQAR